MKIMMLLSRVPYPLEKGDKLRAYHQLKLLSRKHDIVLCCLSDIKIEQSTLDHLSKYCKDIEVIRLKRWQIFLSLMKGICSRLPFQVHYFYNSIAQKRIDRFIEKHMPAHIYCQLIRVSEYITKYTIIPKTIDYMDTFSKGMYRRAEKATFPFNFIFRIEAKRLHRYERSVFSLFENKTIISDQDKACIDHPHKQKIKVVPNGVDTTYFHPVKQKKKFDLLFTGNMHYPPNIESACFLVKQIFPQLHSKGYRPTLLISGANPGREVKNLASSNVFVSGWVPDIRQSYASSKIFIAAMQTGTGLQNKLLEAMAMQLPCITSELANNALGALPGKQILIGSHAEEYADHIIELIENRDLYQRIAVNGHQFVCSNYIWKATVDQLETLIIHTHA